MSDNFTEVSLQNLPARRTLFGESVRQVCEWCGRVAAWALTRRTENGNVYHDNVCHEHAAPYFQQAQEQEQQRQPEF